MNQIGSFFFRQGTNIENKKLFISRIGSYYGLSKNCRLHTEGPLNGWVVVSTEHLIGTGLLVFEEEAVVVDVLVVGTRLGGPSLDLFGVTNNNYQ
jgi:hypothetical protein